MNFQPLTHAWPLEVISTSNESNLDLDDLSYNVKLRTSVPRHDFWGFITFSVYGFNKLTVVPCKDSKFSFRIFKRNGHRQCFVDEIQDN